MPEKIKVGLAGFGKSARVFHIPFISTMEEFEISTVLERKSNASQALFPSVQVVRTIDELADDKNTELIVITTPNDTHFEYAARALKGGKHVVLEKPFTNTLEEADELIKIAKHSGRILSVFQNRRYVSDYLTMKDLIAENVLGDIHEFNATYDRYRPEPVPGSWRESTMPGAGILYDLGPHLLDQVLSLFGNPEAITADVRKQRPHAKADDYFNIWLHYEFLKVILHSGMLVREQGPRYMIQGTRGSFLKYGEDPQEQKLKEGELPVGNNWGAEPEEFYGLLHTEINGKPVRKIIPSRKGNYGQYYKNIYNSIVHGTPVSEKPEDGYNTIKLIRLAFDSSAEKKTLSCSGLR